MLLGGLCALPWFVESLSDRRLKWALTLTGLAALPRLWLIKRQADCGQPALDCLRQVALGSSEDEISSQQMLQRAFHDRFSVELLGLWPLFVLGLFALLLPLSRWVGPSPLSRIALSPQPRHSRALLAFALSGVLGILFVGGAVDSLRPYHLRIASVPLAVAAAVGLSRLWPLALGAGLWACFTWGPREILPPGPVQPSTFDELALHLEDIPGPIWVDGVYLDSPVGLDPAAVVLAAVLQGQDSDRFDVQGDPTVILLVNGQPRTGPAGLEYPVLASGEDWSMIRFESHGSATAWLDMQQAPAAPTGGAWDWLKVLHPVGTDLADTDW
jgi:hypothetical protein